MLKELERPKQNFKDQAEDFDDEYSCVKNCDLVHIDNWISFYIYVK